MAESAMTYDVQKVLALSCAAQRTYGLYLKETESIYTADGKFVCIKHPNKELVRYALGIVQYDHTEPEFQPVRVVLMSEDFEEAEKITKYYKRLMFAAVKGDNDFQTEVNSLLESGLMTKDKVGFIACLPSVYLRDLGKNKIDRALRDCLNESLGEVGSSILDRDCEILQVKRSTNFDAHNILAIIDNKIVSWFSKYPLNLGPCVLVKGKIKGVGENWHTKKVETRLNYVKAAQ